MMNLISVRDYKAEDENFVFNSALNGIYYGNDLFSKIKKLIFLKNYREVLRATLARTSTSVRVACITGDPDEIKGYAILVNNARALMWVFVKKDWRKIGIARALVPDTVTEVTNLTPAGEAIMRKHPNVSFNPFVS